MPNRLLFAILALSFFGVAAAAPEQASPAPPSRPAPPRQAAGASAHVPLPPAIGAAFKKAYPNATIKNVSKETEDGVQQYEVESVDGGRTRDLMYLANGTVMEVEEEVARADLPPAVVAAVAARYPKATTTRRERVTITKGHVVEYELGLTGATVKEVVLTPGGKWVSPK